MRAAQTAIAFPVDQTAVLLVLVIVGASNLVAAIEEIESARPRCSENSCV